MSLRGPRGEHAFQKKIPGEKKSLFGRQLGEIELFSKKHKSYTLKNTCFYFTKHQKATPDLARTGSAL